MTDDRNDEQRPSTRRMEPIDPSAGTGAYPAESHGQQPYEPGSYQSGAPGPDAYSAAPPPQQPGDAHTGYAAEEPARASTTGRTVMLSMITLLALVLLVLAGFLVYRSVNGTEDAVAPVPGTSTAASSTTTTSATSSATTATTTTTPVGTPTTVTYHFTGTGGLIAVNYSSSSGNTVVATAGAPWQVQARVGTGDTAQLTGIVVSGQVTCQIKQGDTILAESTGNGGPITCRATVPTR
ncbi:MAG: hypothetical protein WAW85_06205 [Gordonia sp. (in: high G+C Gram-positive bacteria)]|uniref:hypothetical protein n=1 Tax=Gordonia sp. (in: high G+C Gram-positive bacteria) TaxID=84139 RepID=UPI003BB5A043